MVKAARWVDAGRVVCATTAVPAAADGEVLVRTAYASICGSDLHAVFGRAPGQDAPLGYPGHESVGEVTESRCAGFEPGDLVLTVPHAAAGRCLAEYQALPGSACIRLPAHPPLSHLLMAQQLGTVVFALRRHPLDLVGKDVAIVGQGSAGAFFTFLLKQAGARTVMVSDRSPARLAYSRKLGADIAVEAGSTDLRTAVAEATGGRGADVVVEAVGSREANAMSVELAAAGGTVIWFGLPEGGEQPYSFAFGEFFRRQLTAYSIFGAQGEPGLVSFRHAVHLIEQGAIDVAPLLSHMLPIDDVEKAFHLAHDQGDNALKVSISF